MSHIVYNFTTIEDGNLAYHVKDVKKSVDKNRENLAKKLNFDIKSLVYMNQVHGNSVVVVDKKSPRLIDNCDGIITKEKNLTLMVMVADCIPILFLDKKAGVISAVHAGRNSTFEKIVELTVEKMINELECKKENIEVILGPSIQRCCYEVSPELVEVVKNRFGKEFVNGRLIDLQGINKKLLNKMGVFNVKTSNICTKCSGHNYFSYRKDKNCGRFAGVITIKL